MNHKNFSCENEKCIHNRRTVCTLDYVLLGVYGCCEMQRYTPLPLYSDYHWTDDEDEVDDETEPPEDAPPAD